MVHNATIAILGAGFIGKNLIRHFLKFDHHIRVLDHNECPDEFKGRVKWIKAGFADKEAIEEVLNANVDVAYHMISSTVPGSDTDKRIIQELYDNVITTIEFINICLKVKLKRIVFLSSSSVYGIQSRFPIMESAETNPISAHGIQKLTLEKYLQLFHHIENIDVKIVRLSNPYGPGQNIYGKQGFIAIVIGKLLNGTELLVRNNGNAIRDFIYIDDVVISLQRIGLDQQIPSLINIGSGLACSLNQVVKLIEELSGKRIIKISGEDRKVDIPKSILDISMAQNTIGFSPIYSIREGLMLTLKHHGLVS